MSSSPVIKLDISEKVDIELTKNKIADHDYELTKRNNKTSCIMFSKACITLPFYVVALYEPFYIKEYSWILYMEAFHHFHARIFFLLAIYRSLLQIYFSCFSNGYYQKKFVYIEIWFDITGGTETPTALANLYKRIISFPKGNGIERPVNFTVSGYTLNTWETNGAVVKIRANGTCDIYDIRYVITRMHKAI